MLTSDFAGENHRFSALAKAITDAGGEMDLTHGEIRPAQPSFRQS